METTSQPCCDCGKPAHWSRGFSLWLCDTHMLARFEADLARLQPAQPRLPLAVTGEMALFEVPR